MVLVGSHRFSVVLRGCRMFSVVLYGCHGFSVVLAGTCRFSVVLVDYGSLWFFPYVLVVFQCSCRISMVLSGFRSVSVVLCCSHWFS